jgi:uncharacterized membrane protein YbhN (UPF0104 family)
LNKYRVKRYAIIGAIIGAAVYIGIFMHIYGGNIASFLEVISFKDPKVIAGAYITRFLGPIVHATSWYILILTFRRISYLKVVAITCTSVFVEFIAPIGGITEVVKLALITKLGLLNKEEAIATIAAHRVVVTAMIACTTFLSLYAVNASTNLYLSLMIPSLVLVGLNIGIYLLPRSKHVERILVRLGSKFGVSFEGMADIYSKKINYYITKWYLVFLATTIAVWERLLNGIFGLFVANMTNMSLNIFQSLLAFDSLHTIIWLLPAITPGNVGIYEAIQTALLNLLGISVKEAAAMSIITRVYFLIAEYPTFAASVAFLGLSVTGIIKTLKTNNSKTR